MEQEINKYKLALKKAANKIEELSEQIKRSKANEDIAVIGYACRFPGGANNPEAFWDILINGVDTVTGIPESRFDKDRYYSEDRDEPGKMYTRNGAFLNVPIDYFDNRHFEISPLEAASIDPQQRLLLEVSWEAMENAGLDIEKLKGSRTGVFIGINSSDYVKAQVMSGNMQDINSYSITGISFNAVCGRLSYFYDFKGPSVAFDTACSSSLVALNAAVSSLRRGECGMAVVGGVNMLLGQESFIGLSKINGISRDGRCKAFDASADGFGRGEGCGAVIIKRLSDALRDGDCVHAVVKSVAVGQDGRTNGFTAPNGISQGNVIRQALEMADLSVDDIDYVEAHGAGTGLGDLIEVQALSGIFRNKKENLLIGAVKTNIGHLEGAAGIAGLIKVILAIQKGKIPPSLHFRTPNPNISWENIRVADETVDWRAAEKKRRAGISSFGFTGTLAHAIIEEPPAQLRQAGQEELPWHALTLSAKNEKALKSLIESMRAYIDKSQENLSDICYTANTGRGYMDYRLAIGAENREALVKELGEVLDNPEKYDMHTSRKQNADCGRIAFLFTGQGSIYTNIAGTLYASSKPFKDALDLCNDKFLKLSGISVIDAIYGGDESLIKKPSCSQPVIFSVEYALTKVWDCLGVRPGVVIGHSIGEYAAACYSGLISLDDAVLMIAHRGRMMEAADIDGKMVGVLTDEESVKSAIYESGCKNVYIAAVNAPRNVTVSGLSSEVDAVLSALQQKQRVFIDKLNIQHPYHCSLMMNYTGDYAQKIKGVSFSKPDVAMISTISGKLEDEGTLGKTGYWTEHLAKAVKFRQAIEAAVDMGITSFVEIGGDATLSGLASQCADGEGMSFLPSLRKGVNDYKQLLGTVCSLYLNGVEISWHSFYEPYKKERVLIPNYPFRRKKFWKELRGDLDAGSRPDKNICREVKEVEKMEEKQQKASDGNAEKVQAELKKIINLVSGLEIEEIDSDTNLFSLGFDSLILVTFKKQIDSKYNIEIPLNEFFLELNTVEKIGQHICSNAKDIFTGGDSVAEIHNSTDNVYGEGAGMQSAVPAVSTYAQQPVYEPGGDLSFDNPGIQGLFNNQLKIMAEQIDVLKRMPGAAAGAQNTISGSVKAVGIPAESGGINSIAEGAVQTKPEKADAEKINFYVPYKKLALNEKEKIDELKERYVKSIEAKYTGLTQSSKQNIQFYRQVYANNRNVAGFRPLLKEMVYQIVARKGKGSKVVDIDGNELIDLTMGFGVSLFGHCPRFVEDALTEEIQNGLPVGPMGRLAGEVARQISELTGAERVAFYNSGTEAIMVAVRIARAITGKNKIVIFAGSYHGTYDGVLGLPSFSDKSRGAIPLAPGITENMVKDLMILKYNDEESLEIIRNNSHDIAAVLAETVQSRRPDVRPSGFLKKLRSLTEERDIALIFDEIVTGFRICAGGAQEHFGIKADIAAYGKVIGGGMPIGVVAGKGKYLDSIDGGMWRFGDDSIPPCDERRTFVAGTFAHHPMAMAASNAVLTYIKENKEVIYRQLNSKTDGFAERVNKIFKEESIPMEVVNFGSLFRFVLKGDFEIFFYGLLEKGIYIWEGRNCFFSTEHSDEDIEKIISAIELTVYEMKEAGYFGNPGGHDPGPGPGSGKSGEHGRGTGGSQGGGTIPGVLPMSIIQQRLYSHMLMTGSDPYDIVSAYIVKEELDTGKIEAVVNGIIKRHEILRTAMYLEEGEYKQRVLDEWQFKVREIARDKDMDINESISRALSTFDLSKAPLLEIILLTMPSGQKIIVFHFHHTVSDGMSMDLFVDEFSKLYKNVELPPLKRQYRDYVIWEQNYLNSDKLKKDGEYWVNRLKGVPAAPAVPYDYPEPGNTGYPGNTVIGCIDGDELYLLKKTAKDNGVSLFMVLLAAVNVLLHKTTRENEIAVSTPATSRFEGGFEDCIGMFTNTIVLKNRISPDESFEQFLKDVRMECLQAYTHTSYPYNQLIKQLNLTGQNAFSTEFVYENVGGRSADQTGMKLKGIQYIPAAQEADITFELLEYGGTVDIFLRYRTDLFKEESIRRLLKRLLLVIRQIASNPRVSISHIETITDEERKLVLGEFNNTSAGYPREKTVVDLFEEQARKTPDNIALIFEGQQLTYAGLNAKANVLANRLRGLGVGRDDFVAVIAQRGVEMVAAIYGVIKAGGAYVPIIPEYPADRIEYMLKDCKPKAVLAYKSQVKTEIPVIDLGEPESWEGIAENPGRVNKPGDIIYLIYTSGTTGVPKGVMVEHGNVVRLLKNDSFQFDFNENDVWMMFHSCCFDFSVWEMYGAALYGGKLVLVSGEAAKDSYAVCSIIQQNKVTVLNQVPSSFYNLMNSDSGNQMQSVRYLIFGGEALNPSRLYKWHESYRSAKIINMYGITETTVHVTYREIGDEEITRGISDIGRAIPTLRVYIMNGGNLCGIGVPGELCVTGDGVARGYLNNTALTGEKFADNPFGEGKMYRSGDLARWMPDGNIEYLGRIDEQVKIRGFRIELGEIDNRLRAIEAITDAAVIVRKDNSGEWAIYAYIVSEHPADLTAIRAQLESTLPDYMIPSYMMQIGSIPVTGNGKLDKRALPEIEARVENEYAAPGNDVEAALCKAFEEVLGIQRVGIRDSFFDLGGHSLRATKLVNRIEASTGCKVALKEVFANPTAEKLSMLISGKGGTEYTPIPRAGEKEYYPMSSVQKRTYLICQMNNNGTAYNMPGSLKLTGEVRADEIKDVLQQMTDRHEILRTEFLMVDGEPVQRILKTAQADYEYISDTAASEQQLMESFIRPFDLGRAPLVRIRMVKRKDCHILMIDTHHIISDGMSMETFTREFTELYNGKTLPPLTHQYRDYSEWMRARDLSVQRQYWVNEFRDEIPVLDIPCDYARPQEQSYKGAVAAAETGRELGMRIKALAAKSGATEYMIFLSSAMVLLSKYSRQEDVVIGSPISGRTHKDTEGMLGMFVNTLAMRGRPEGKKSYTEFLAEIKSGCLKAYENQEYPFEQLVEALEVRKDMSRNPLFDVMLAFQNNEREEIRLSGADIQYSEYKSGIAKFDLSFDIKENKDNGFEIELEYCRDLFKPQTAERMLRHFIAVLGQLTEKPDISLSETEAITLRERLKILGEFNNTHTDYPGNKTVVELFEQQAEKTPDNIAVVFENEQLTYGQLNARANALASRLRGMGVMPDDFVAIIAHKSIEMIAGVCGIIKSGAAYVPIDAAYPEDRVCYILDDCKPKALLVCGGKINTGIPVINLSDTGASEDILQNPPRVNKPNDLAYVIYTSGTTGRPKGVMIEHKSIVKLVKNSDYTVLDDKTVILQTGQLAFDASTFEMWGCFLNGGKLHLLRDSVLLDGDLFKSYLIRNKINTMFITTALFNQMIGYDNSIFDSLEHLLFGGEATSEAHLKILRDRELGLDFRNVYGPTETTTFASHYIIKDEVAKTPIGRPISNTQIYIMNGSRLCGIGVPGELCITGDGLSRGYLNNPELTAEKFADNPFGEGRMYRSGDLVRWLPDGNIEYLGRIDGQVKIRGFRIELGEIKSAIRKIDYVIDCAVIARTDPSGDKAICAYIVADDAINISGIREKLRTAMPQYMIPAYIMQIGSIPVNRNGKLDKEALPEIEARSENEYAAPANQAEAVLCRALEEVLGVARAGIKDSFFELGGDSLKAIRVISKVRDLGYSVTVQHIMQYQVVESICRAMHPIGKGPVSDAADAPIYGEVPLGAIQKLFIKSNIYNPNHFNMSMMLEMSGRISADAMLESINAVVRHHDMLRSVVRDGRVFIRKCDEDRLFEFKTHDLRCCGDDDGIRQSMEEYVLQSQRSINLEAGPLVSVRIFSLKESDHMHICINHFVVDAVSMRIIAEDIFTAYYYCSNREAVRLPRKTAAFGEWVSRLSDFSDKRQSGLREKYWKNINKRVGQLALPVKGDAAGAGTAAYLGSIELRGLNILAGGVLGAGMNHILTAAAAKALCDKYRTGEIAVNVEVHGRYDVVEDIFVDRTVGWFTSMYPLIFKAGEDFGATLLAMLDAVKEIPGNGIGYLQAMDKIGASNINLPQVTVNYLGDIDESSNAMHHIKMSRFSCGQDMDKMNAFLSPLSINVNTRKDDFRFNFVYDRSVWRMEDIEDIFERICKILARELESSKAEIEAMPVSGAWEQPEQLIKAAGREMDRYESDIVSNKEFTDYPLTGIQRVSYEMRSRNAVIDIPFFDRIDLEKFNDSWMRLHSIFDVLRSSIPINEDGGFIRIYGLSSIRIPFIDISKADNSDIDGIIRGLLEMMDCYEQEAMYAADKLSSKVLLVKVSETAYRLLLSCSHLIFDRFSSEVLKNKLADVYYGNGGKLSECSYKDYHGLLCNRYASVPEDEIIEFLGLERFYNSFKSFYKRNRHRELKTYIYEYSNREAWSRLTEKEMLTVSQDIFIKAMQFIFKDADIPFLTLHIARKNRHVNLFEYIGEFLDVLPMCISRREGINIEDEIQEKLSFMQRNDLYFSSLFFKDGSDKYPRVRKMLSEIFKMSKYVLVCNNTGILKSANNVVVNSDKYRIYYNVISVVINNDGIFMNIPVDSTLPGEIKDYLDSAVEGMLAGFICQNPLH